MLQTLKVNVSKDAEKKYTRTEDGVVNVWQGQIQTNLTRRH